jgi:hypothetical protein
MRKVLIYVPVVLSLVILGAHFMRYGNSIGVFGSLVLVALLIVRRPWVAVHFTGWRKYVLRMASPSPA